MRLECERHHQNFIENNNNNKKKKNRSKFSIYKLMFCNPRNKQRKIFPNVAEGSISFYFSKMMPEFIKIHVVRYF